MDLTLIRDVDLRPVTGDDLELPLADRRSAHERRRHAGRRNCPGEHEREVAADLTASPRDQDTHNAYFESWPQLVSTTGARSRSGAHHDSFSAYHFTVSAIPAVNSIVGSHPSSVRILVVSNR